MPASSIYQKELIYRILCFPVVQIECGIVNAKPHCIICSSRAMH
ncbi:hypothetical protein APHDU1_0934 [Anaplasma phagocytophilum]|nr:hypothetical protein APHDU1_0934 [Anaplasma phagocytophilum]